MSLHEFVFLKTRDANDTLPLDAISNALWLG